MNARIYFPEARNGYDTEEVDSYIGKLSEAYQTAYCEYNSVKNEYEKLLEDCKKLAIQERTALNSDVVAKTLMNTELLAQKIIAEAHDEALAAGTKAKKIIDDAHVEADRIVGSARKKLEQAHTVIGRAASEVQRLITLNAPDTAEDIGA